MEPLDRFAAEHFPGHRDEPREAEPNAVKAYDFESAPPADATPEIAGAIEAHAGVRHFDASDFEAASIDASAVAPMNGHGDGHAEEHPTPALSSLPSMDDTQTIDAIRSSAMPWHSAPSAIRNAEHELAKQLSEAGPEQFQEQEQTRDVEGTVEAQIPKTFAEECNTGSAESSAISTPQPVDATDYEAPVYEAIGVESESLLDSPAIAESLSAAISSSAAETFAVPTPTAMDPRQLEEIVTRVVERMQPQVLEVITREILRPVVEALVRRQLELK
jgi:hypothetical protein